MGLQASKQASKTVTLGVSGLSKVPGLLGLPTWVYIIEGGRMEQMAAPTIVVKHFARPPPLTLPDHTHKPSRSRYTPPSQELYTFGAP